MANISGIPSAKEIQIIALKWMARILEKSLGFNVL